MAAVGMLSRVIERYSLVKARMSRQTALSLKRAANASESLFWQASSSLVSQPWAICERDESQLQARALGGAKLAQRGTNVRDLVSD